MRRLPTMLLLVGVLVAPSACSRREISSDDAGGSGGSAFGTAASATTEDDSSATAQEATSDGATLPPLQCEAPYVTCDDECAILTADAANCGECGHQCNGWGTTRKCRNSQCEPAVWPCIKPDQGIDTCAQACASVGQTCATDAYCSNYVRVWMTTSANDNNPEANIEACERLVDGNTSFTQECHDPIDWNYTSSGKTVLGVACCCTQT